MFEFKDNGEILFNGEVIATVESESESLTDEQRVLFLSLVEKSNCVGDVYIQPVIYDE